MPFNMVYLTIGIVIAGILVVAGGIAVGVLFAPEGSGFWGDDYNYGYAPTGTISASAAAGGNETLSFGRFSPDTAPMEVELIVFPPGPRQDMVICGFISNTDGPLDCWSQAVEMTYSDLVDNRLLNVGDSILLGGLWGPLEAGTWEVELFHSASGETIDRVLFTK